MVSSYSSGAVVVERALCGLKKMPTRTGSEAIEAQSQLPLLAASDLVVSYSGTALPALRGVSFAIQRSEILAVLGESGSGKTTLGLTIMGLLPPGARIVQGSIRFGDLELTEQALKQLRGSEISMIFQEAGNALNPFLRTVDQVEEVIRAHRSWPRDRRQQEARRLLTTVRLSDSLQDAWPHQLSGGERQRLVIAQALACEPDLLIADEPVASLDPSLQIEWLNLIRDLRTERGLAVLLITHNPAIVQGLADHVLVLHAGRVVEYGRCEEVLQSPRHPYTQALLEALPPPPGIGRGVKGLSMLRPGTAAQAGPGRCCSFHVACPDLLPECDHQDPPEISIMNRTVRCFKYVG